MKKIVCLIDSLVSGGAQRQLVGLACLLKSNGFEVTVMTYHDIPFYLEQLQKNGVSYINVEKAANTKTRVFYITRALRAYSPDVVIAYLDVPCIVAIISKLLGCHFKLIVSERNTTQRLSVKDRIKFYLYRYAETIVPNSSSQAEFICANFPFLKSKVHPITNFVDTEIFKPGSKSIRGKSLRILSVGRVTEQKNILRYIEAIYRIRLKGIDVQVNWFGECFKDYYEKCSEKIRKYRLESIFRFFDASKDIALQYAEADVFCLPSIYEGFPNVICEAMSCGLPILCSNICDNPIIVKEGLNGLLFNPLSIDDIVSTIEKYNKLDFSTKKKMGDASRSLALNNFSSRTFVQKYIQLISNL